MDERQPTISIASSRGSSSTRGSSEEALDRSNPLLERMKFLAIVSSNFDEFFMVRVASLKAQLRAGDATPDGSGMSPAEQLAAVSRAGSGDHVKQYECLAEILPALEREGLAVVRPSGWTGPSAAGSKAIFPSASSPSSPPCAWTGAARTGAPASRRPARCASTRPSSFPASEETGFAVVQVPPNLDRFVRMPAEGTTTRVGPHRGRRRLLRPQALPRLEGSASPCSSR